MLPKTWTTKSFKVNSMSLNWSSLSVTHQQHSHLISQEFEQFIWSRARSPSEMICSSEDKVRCGDNDMTLNLISDASMETFPGNNLSNFTTLLPTPMTLSGDRQVALLEIPWPALVCNVTEGKITVSKRIPSPESPVYPTNQNFPSGWPGIVSMGVPRQFRKEPAMKFGTPEVRYIKAGCYSSVDDIKDAIMECTTGNSNEKVLSPNIQQNKEAPSQSTNLSSKIDKATQELRVKFYGNVEKHDLVIQAISQDLKNIPGKSTIIDCQNAEQWAATEEKHTVDGKFHDDQQNTSELTVVKNVGHWPVDVNAGSHTIFLYCDLVQNETLGDAQTALLRSIPLNSLSSTNQFSREVNHRSFSNLQWKEFTNHNSQQSPWLWPMKRDRGCLFWVLVEQALIWHLGLNHNEQKCVGGVTSNEDGTLHLQKMNPSYSSFRKQIRN